MCLAIPMKVLEVRGEFAEVSSGSLRRKVNVQMVPRLARGEYVIVHAGFAIQRLDRKQAEETLRIIAEDTG